MLFIKNIVQREVAHQIFMFDTDKIGEINRNCRFLKARLSILQEDTIFELLLGQSSSYRKIADNFGKIATDVSIF